MAAEKFLNIFGTLEKEIILQLTDAKLTTDEGCVFNVHKVILARKNNYFCQLFCGIGSKDRTEFSIPGVSGETLSDILVYLYTGKISLQSKNVINIMIAADYLLVDDLLNEIQESINKLIVTENSVLLLVHADKINNMFVFNAAFRFIQTHFNDIVDNHRTQLTELSLEHLCKILCNPNLYVLDEKPVWLSIVEWVQSDLQNRLFSVPLMLKYLAKKDVDENLAKEIVSHSIVANNPCCVVSNKLKSGANLQDLISSDHFLDHRLPLKLYVVVKRIFDKVNKTDMSYVYITYDENLDMWRKITEIEFYPEDVVIMNHYLCLFSQKYESEYFKLDLNEKSLTQLYSFPNLACVGKCHQLIYVLSEKSNRRQQHIAILDPENNLFRRDIPCFDGSCYSKAASIQGYIYVVGAYKNRMAAQVYKPESNTWSNFPAPEVYRYEFSFTAYHEKLFVIGGTDRDGVHLQEVEIFDLKSNTWRRVASLPNSHNNIFTIIWDDKLCAYQRRSESTTPQGEVLLWNEPQEYWQEMGETFPLLNSDSYRFCEIDDALTIKMISKGSRSLNAELQKSDFS